MAKPWILQGSHLLDVGCHQGEFFEYLGDWISRGVGIDPLGSNQKTPRVELRSQYFEAPLDFSDEIFDVITLLATLEHIRDKNPLPLECRRLLRVGGRVILTVPSPRVDSIVAFLRFLRLADGMSVEQHHDFQPDATPLLFLKNHFVLEHHIRFQLGLNHLFVFSKKSVTEALNIE